MANKAKPSAQADKPKEKKEFRGLKGVNGKRASVVLEQDDATISISFTKHNKDGTETHVSVTAFKIGKKKP